MNALDTAEACECRRNQIQRAKCRAWVCPRVEYRRVFAISSDLLTVLRFITFYYVLQRLNILLLYFTEKLAEIALHNLLPLLARSLRTSLRVPCDTDLARDLAQTLLYVP